MGARSVGAVARVTIACPAEQAVRVVQDIKGIERTELKVDHVEVYPADAEHGTYTVTGHFGAVPWRSRFAYRLHATGFHSHKPVDDRPRSWAISGGFTVAPLDRDRCLVLHYEDYEVPGYLAPLKPAILLYLRWSMRAELERLRHIALRRHR